MLFEGKRELFKGLAIDSLEKEWKKHPVFHLSFGGQNFVEPHTLDNVLEEFVARAEQLYGKDEFAVTLGSRFQAVLRNAHAKLARERLCLLTNMTNLCSMSWIWTSLWVAIMAQ